MKIRIAVAMLAIYLVWGSTYLAIRFAVETIPPFIMAGTRYLIPGLLLFVWRRLAGDPAPTRRQWIAGAIVGLFLLLGGNGLLSWAELRLESGVAALIVGTAPIWMVFFDAALTHKRPRWQVIVGLLTGFGGIILLVGPASLFGNLCVANAENLSSVVVYQLHNPGRPLMLGSATGIVDFLSGAYLGGVSEMGLMSAGMTAMANYYRAPSCAAGCTADAKSAGPEAVLQKFSTTLPPALMATDVIVGYGAVEGDQLLVLEQLVVDEEIAQWCRRLAQGIDGGEGKDLFDDIQQVGPGGHFLKSKNTRLAPRSGEFFIDRLMPRGSYESWAMAGKPSMYQRARERVSEILAGPVIDPLPEAVSEKLDEIVHRAAADLKDEGE